MTYRVIIQPRAERDIWAAAQWVEDQSKSPAKALRWVRSIRAKIATLQANPSDARSIPVPTHSERKCGCCSMASGMENTASCSLAGAARCMS